MLIQCCVCKKIEDGDGWTPAGRVIHDASHTYCPKCAESVRKEIRELKQAGPPQPRRRSAVHALQELFNPQFYTRPDLEGR